MGLHSVFVFFLVCAPWARSTAEVNNPGQDALRESMWQTGYDTTAPLYRFLAQLNKVRKSLQMGTGESDVKDERGGKGLARRAAWVGLGTAWGG